MTPLSLGRGAGGEGSLRPGAARLRAARTACGPGGIVADHGGGPVRCSRFYVRLGEALPAFFAIAAWEPGGKSCPAGPRTSSGPVHTDAVKLAQLHAAVWPGDRLGNCRAAARRDPWPEREQLKQSLLRRQDLNGESAFMWRENGCEAPQGTALMS